MKGNCETFMLLGSLLVGLRGLRDPGTLSNAFDLFGKYEKYAFLGVIEPISILVRVETRHINLGAG